MGLHADATPREVAESYWAAEEQRNVERILDHYHNDAVFNLSGQRLAGHDQIRTYYESSGAKYPGLTVKIVHEVVDGQKAAIEWEAHLTDEAGTTVPLSGVNIIHVEDGKFREVRAYFDPTIIRD